MNTQSELRNFKVRISWQKDGRDHTSTVEIECADDATQQQMDYIALEALNKNRRVRVFETEVFEKVYTPIET